jgi:hypothetical protein
MWPAWVVWQVRITGRLQQLLPSFIPSMLGLGHTTAVDKVVVDNERHILYCLNQPSTIQVCVCTAAEQDSGPGRKVIHELGVGQTDCS